MKKSKFVVAVVAMTLLSSAAFGQDIENGTSLREKIISNDMVGRVVAIDEHYTHVLPNIPALGLKSGSIPAEFTQALIEACDTRWQVRGFDPLTSKTGWVPYDGKANLYTREIEDKVTKRKETVNGARCIDRFEITDVWGAWRSTSSDGSYRYFQAQNFIVKHNSPQPFKYKDQELPENVVMLPEGEVNALNPGKAEKKGFFAKMLTTDKPSSISLFEYGRALCEAGKGTPRGLANEGTFTPNPAGRNYSENVKGDFRDTLVEEPMIDVYKHIFTGGYTGSHHIAKEWYFACEGPSAFIVRERENRKYTNNGKPRYSTTTYFAPGRGLDGIDFVKK